MVILAVLALVLGVLVGTFDVQNFLLDALVSNKDLVLYLLMFSVGMIIGLHKGIIKKIKEYHVKILIIPAGIIVGTLLGGVLLSMVTKYNVGESTSVVSGLGWYSLAGVTIGNLAGAQLGSIAFLSNLMREIFSFFTIPFIAKHFNYYSCIAPAAATSEDTTLPMMMKYTNEETVVLSVINGVLCSAVVPVLIPLCYQLKF